MLLHNLNAIEVCRAMELFCFTLRLLQRESYSSNYTHRMGMVSPNQHRRSDTNIEGNCRGNRGIQVISNFCAAEDGGIYDDEGN